MSSAEQKFYTVPEREGGAKEYVDGDLLDNVIAEKLAEFQGKKKISFAFFSFVIMNYTNELKNKTGADITKNPEYNTKIFSEIVQEIGTILRNKNIEFDKDVLRHAGNISKQEVVKAGSRRGGKRNADFKSFIELSHPENNE